MLEIGAMLNNLEPDRLAAFAVAARHGFRVVHTSALAEAWLDGAEEQRAYLNAVRASRVQVQSMFVGYDGQNYRDLATIARTVGLAVPELRERRLAVTLAYVPLAWSLGARSVSTHLGLFPSDPQHPEHRAMVEVVRQVADACARSHLTFNLETGQESARELLEFIREVNRDNVAVNFDAANFLLYNTDDPVTALDVLGDLVHGVHCKDGLRPTEPGVLGKEVPLGTGQVDWPALLQRALGYRGPLIIEREHGPNVLADILAARTYLEGLQRE